MAKRKTLLVDGVSIKVGDVIQEYSSSRNFSMFKVTEVNEEQTYMYMDVLFSTGFYTAGRSIGADIQAHYYEKGDTMKTFVLDSSHPFVILHTK